MYNHLLDTFITVAENGSFSKAAAVLYITPSAVIQKINALETDLGVSLFNRTRQGVTLTEQGKLLLTEGKKYILEGNALRQRLLDVGMREKTIMVGTSIAEKCRILYDLWIRYPDAARDSVQMRTIDVNRPIPDEIDLIESVQDGASWQHSWEFLSAGTVPFVLALSHEHPLVSKEVVTYADLVPYPVVIIEHGNTAPAVLQMHETLKHHGIQALQRPDFGAATVWESACNNYPIIVPRCWKDVVFDQEFRVVDWDFSLPYGLFYRPDASAPAKRFLAYAEKELGATDFLSKYC